MMSYDRAGLHPRGCYSSFPIRINSWAVDLVGKIFSKAYEGFWSLGNFPMVSAKQKKLKAGPSVIVGGFQSLTPPEQFIQFSSLTSVNA